MTDEILERAWPEWKIDKKIGRGSYGVVYKAVRRDIMESSAAIKVISIPADASEVDSLRSEGMDVNATRTYLKNIVNDFVGEIQIMESFKGMQNIVSVEDYKVVEKPDEIGWDIFIRMELLTPFNKFICDRKLTEEDVIRLGCDICTALEICGRRNIIHRDIKPDNIFINDFGYYKLGDFGIARKMENLTGGLSQKGTFNYMAPEVANSRDYDSRVDIYSLGIVLYRLLNCNRLPFLDTEKQILSPSDKREAFERRIRGDRMPPPCEATPSMAEVILKACEFEPDERFSNATEMKKALQQVGQGTYRLSGDELDRTYSICTPRPVLFAEQEPYEEVPAAPVRDVTVQQVNVPAQKAAAVQTPTAPKPAENVHKVNIAEKQLTATIPIQKAAAVQTLPTQEPVANVRQENISEKQLTATIPIHRPQKGEVEKKPSAADVSTQEVEKTVPIPRAPFAKKPGQKVGDSSQNEHKVETARGVMLIIVMTCIVTAIILIVVVLFNLSSSGQKNLDPVSSSSSLDEVEYILSQADKLAMQGDYDGAVRLIDASLDTYTDSDNHSALLEKKEEYTQAASDRDYALEQAEQLAGEGHYVSAVALLKSKLQDSPYDKKLKAAISEYEESYSNSSQDSDSPTHQTYETDTRELTTIEVSDYPIKTTYYVGEFFDPEGMTLIACYSDSTRETIYSGFECIPVAFESAGPQYAYVLYNGLTTFCLVTVLDNEPEDPSAAATSDPQQEVQASQIVSVGIYQKPDKTVYNIGDRFDSSGLKVGVNYGNNVKEVISSGFECSKPSMDAAGQRKVTVTYKGYSTSFTITVNEKKLSLIRIKSRPDKTSYDVGETLQTKGLKIEAVYSDGTTKTISGGFECSPVKLTSAGSKMIEVTYMGCSARFTVSVEELQVSSISIYQEPDKKSYIVGEAFDPTGMVLNATYSNGTTEKIYSGFDWNLQRFDSTGPQRVTITYKNCSVYCIVSVSINPLYSVYKLYCSEQYSDGVFVGYKLSGYVRIDPKNDVDIEVESTIDAEISVMQHYDNDKIFSLIIPNDRFYEGGNTLTVTTGSSCYKYSFYLEYLGDYSSSIGKSKVKNGGWKLTEWYAI